jgi:hypothetical protein
VKNICAYGLGCLTGPALWLLWHVFAVLFFTIRDTWRMFRGESAELWRAGRPWLAVLSVFICPIVYFFQRLRRQIDARLNGYTTEIQ